MSERTNNESVDEQDTGNDRASSYMPGLFESEEILESFALEPDQQTDIMMLRMLRELLMDLAGTKEVGMQKDELLSQAVREPSPDENCSISLIKHFSKLNYSLAESLEQSKASMSARSKTLHIYVKAFIQKWESGMRTNQIEVMEAHEYFGPAGSFAQNMPRHSQSESEFLELSSLERANEIVSNVLRQLTQLSVETSEVKERCDERLAEVSL